MLCEQILGRINDFTTDNKTIEYVDIEWHEAFKKIHKKTTSAGRPIGIRLDDTVLSRGLYEGDVLYADDDTLIVVHTPPCEVIKIQVRPDHAFMVPKVCYEVGNRHAPFFYGDDEFSFITPYNEPMLKMLNNLHGVTAEKITTTLNFDKRISSNVHHHHH